MDSRSGFWKWVGLSVLVVVVGLALGFYLSAPPADENVAQTGEHSAANNFPASTITSSTSAPPPMRIGEFTAQGAPSIQIEEQRPEPKKAAAARNSTSASSTSSLPNAQSTSSTPPDEATSPGPPPAADVPPPQPAPQAIDATPPPASPSSQPGAVSPDASAPLYHVLVGTTFTNEKNARIFAADLRHRGFMAMTSSVASDNGTVYKVQVGAYRSRTTAEQMAGQLQQSGYPAYIATDR